MVLGFPSREARRDQRGAMPGRDHHRRGTRRGGVPAHGRRGWHHLNLVDRCTIHVMATFQRVPVVRRCGRCRQEGGQQPFLRHSASHMSCCFLLASSLSVSAPSLNAHKAAKFPALPLRPPGESWCNPHMQPMVQLALQSACPEPRRPRCDKIAGGDSGAIRSSCPNCAAVSLSAVEGKCGDGPAAVEAPEAAASAARVLRSPPRRRPG